MENSSKRDPLNIIIAIAVIVIIILLGYMGSLALKNNLISLPKSNKTSPASTKVTLNPDALYLSFPITNLSSAKITGKSSNSLIVEVNAQTLPNTDSKVLSFKVAITDTTSITQPIPNIPYAFKSPTTNTPPLPPIANQLAITLKDLSRRNCQYQLGRRPSLHQQSRYSSHCHFQTTREQQSLRPYHRGFW